MKSEFKLNKIKIFLTVLIALVFLAASVVIQIMDPDASMIFNIINYITMILFFYYAVLFVFDLFAKRGGLVADENGIFINYGYFKNTQLSWEHITGVKQDKRLVLILVDNPDYYISKLPFVTRILIYNYKNKFGTLYLLRGFFLDSKTEKLYGDLHAAFLEYGQKN